MTSIADMGQPIRDAVVAGESRLGVIPLERVAAHERARSRRVKRA